MGETLTQGRVSRMPSAVGSASKGLKKEKDLTRKGGEACFRLS